MTLLNETRIRYFLTVAKHLSLSSAAEELFITQQALSKQISQLEQDLDCILLERNPRGVSLTEAGEIMVRAFNSMQNCMDQAIKEINQKRQDNASLINLGICPGLRPAPFLSPLCRKYQLGSCTRFLIGQTDSYLDLVRWLAEGKFDMVFFTDDYGGHFPDLQTLSLCSTPFYFFVSRENPLATATASLRDFQDLPFYLVDNQKHIDLVLSLCTAERFMPSSLQTTANPYSTHIMVEMNNSITFGTGLSILHMNPAIRAIRISNASVHLLCAWHPAHINSRTQLWLQFLREQCSPDNWYFPSQT